MSKFFKSGVQVGGNTVQFTSSMVEVHSDVVNAVKKTTCRILSNDGTILGEGSVKKLSTDNDVTDIARKHAAKKALDVIESKETKQQLYGWYIPLMQELEG